MFYFHAKTQTFVFKFLRFEERFEKLRCFGGGLVWTVGLTLETKLRFQISPTYIVYFPVRQQISVVFVMTQHAFEGTVCRMIVF